MDMKGNNRTHADATASGITAPLHVDGVDRRMRAELEQAQMAMEDMNDRIVELARANEELTDKLQEEMRLRQEVEQQLVELRSKSADRRPEDAENDMLRHELSMAIEELQIMQEELQAAHDELGRRDQTCSTNQVSESLAK